MFPTLAKSPALRKNSRPMSDLHFHVLLVEDDPRDIEQIRRGLESLGFPEALLRVAALDQAIDYLSGRKPFEDRKRHPLPELILVSLSLSRKGGFKLLKWLREKKGLRGIPVVVLASARQPVGYEQASEFGAVSYLVKPVEPEALESMIKAVLNYWMLNK